MARLFLAIYRFIFCRSVLYRFNYHLQRLTLRGIGIMNSEGNDITGETFLLRSLRGKNITTVIDIGANTGGYSEEVQRYIPNATIYAIEPHPLTFKRLKKHLTGKAYQLRNLGMGERSGKGILYDFADDAVLKSTQPTSTLASTVKSVITSFHKQQVQSFSFPLMTLDTFVHKERIESIDLLKIDTEGNELQVLKGAQMLLKHKKIRFIQFEFNEMNAYAGTFFKDFIELLPGYTFYRLMPYGLYPMGPYKPSTHEIFAFQNILAVPEGETI